MSNGVLSVISIRMLVVKAPNKLAGNPLIIDVVTQTLISYLQRIYVVASTNYDVPGLKGTLNNRERGRAPPGQLLNAQLVGGGLLQPWRRSSSSSTALTQSVSQSNLGIALLATSSFLLR